MTKTSTKTKPVRDKSGRFASETATKARTRRTRKPVQRRNAFIYDDDAVELPSKPYTSPRVERNKARRQSEIEALKPGVGHWVITALLLFILMALSYVLGATQDWGWR